MYFESIVEINILTST